MKNALIGFATNADPKLLERFCRSAREHHSINDTEILLGVQSLETESARIAERYGIVPLATPNAWPRRPSKFVKIAYHLMQRSLAKSPDAGAQRILDGFVASWQHPHYARWRFYADALRLRPSVDRAFLTDVTDVCFQGNIFRITDDASLHVFDQSCVFDGESVDSQWMRGAFGDARLSELRGKRAICIGTLLGRRATLIEVAEKLWSVFRAGRVRGVEQAIFNDLLYRGELPSYTLHENGDGVLTLSSGVDHARIQIGSNGVCWAGRSPAAVIHMYHRNQSVLRSLFGDQ